MNKEARPHYTPLLDKARLSIIKAYKFIVNLLSDHSFKKLVQKRVIKDGPFKGGSKVVYIIESDNSNYALSIIRLNVLTKEAIEAKKERIRSIKQWYLDNFNEFVNREIIVSSRKNPSVLISIQPWVEKHDEYGGLFYNIIENKELIIQAAYADKRLAANILELHKITYI